MERKKRPFSVVIPAYNCESTIEKSIESVLNQTRIDLVEEIIVVNDGSTDNTDAIIEKLKESNDLIRYYKQENKGAASARNTGIRNAYGEWIALLDADDAWRNNKIERQYDIISNNPEIEFLGSHYPIKFIRTVYTSGLHKINAKQLCIRYMPTTPSVVFRKETGIELGLYNENMRYTEDINFFQKFLLRDSYYILAEDLVELHLGKAFIAERGLSSHLVKMARGRDKNTIELYEMNLISFPYMICMLVMNQFKLARRLIQDRLSRVKTKKTLDSI